MCFAKRYNKKELGIYGVYLFVYCKRKSNCWSGFFLLPIFLFFIRLHTQTSLFMYYRHHTIFVFVGWLACYVRCNLQQSIWNVKIFCIFFFCNERMKNFEGEKMKSCMLWMVSMKTIRSKSKQKPTYMTFFRSCGQFFNFRWKNGLGLNIIYWSLTDFFYQNIDF